MYSQPICALSFYKSKKIYCTKYFDLIFLEEFCFIEEKSRGKIYFINRSARQKLKLSEIILALSDFIVTEFLCSSAVLRKAIEHIFLHNSGDE